MSRRSEGRFDDPPAIELTAVEPSSTPWGPAGPATLELGPPGRALVTGLQQRARRLRRSHVRTIGIHRGFDPRRQSVVEHRLHGRAVDVAGAVAGIAGGALRDPRPDAMAYDPVEHEFRLPAEMHVPWSWPDLPVWVGVAELTSSICALRISLRSRRRLRYPARYFDTAHCALAEVERRIEAAVAR